MPWIQSFADALSPSAQGNINPIYAIKSATYWPSVLMGVDDQVGTISEGKYADIIAVKGDVLRYNSLLQSVDFVMKHGKRYK